MTNVKRVFFITKEEAKQLGDYVLDYQPHYELEDGTIVYTKGAVSDYAIETWVEKDRDDFKTVGYGPQYNPADGQRRVINE